MVNKMIKKIKSNIKEIHWPTKKEVVVDTVFTLLSTTILTVLIMFWTMGIDKIVQLVLDIF